MAMWEAGSNTIRMRYDIAKNERPNFIQPYDPFSPTPSRRIAALQPYSLPKFPVRNNRA